MKDKLLLFVKSFYRNDLLLKAYKLGGGLTFVLLIINIMLVSVPPVLGSLTNTADYEDFPAINEAFATLYDKEIDCVLEDSQMQCETEGPIEAGEYTFEYVDSIPQASQFDSSKIYFTPNDTAIVHVDGEAQTILSANYATQMDLDFSEVAQRASDSGDVSQHYNTQTENFINNLYFSSVGSTMMVVYPAQFAQMGTYIVLVGLMLMITNYKAKFKKITVPSAMKITIAAMTGPALLTAILGLVAAQWSFLIFTIVYLVRIIAVYYRINATEVPLY